jgi:hypothetical protein
MITILVFSTSEELMSNCAYILSTVGYGENRKQSDLALKCIDQLMNTSTFNFSRYGVDVSDTLMHCISLARTPIHPVRSFTFLWIVLAELSV